MLPPEIPVPRDLPVSKEGMEEVEYLRLEAWYNRFRNEPSGGYHPEGHWLFACHAAFPVLLTPELLYHLWLNFRTFPAESGEILYIPYIAVSDLLLSDLVKEVSTGMYEMYPGIRFALLQYLQQTTAAGGPERIRQIAGLVKAWAELRLTGTDDRTQAFRETQQWATEVYLNPAAAIRQVYGDMQKAYEKQDAHAQLRLNARLENLEKQYRLRLQVNPDTDYAAQLQHLLNYSQGTKNLLYDRTEAAITAFSRIPEPDLRAVTGNTFQGALTIPREVGGKLRREKPGPGHDGEQIYALIVGIDIHADANIPQLSGCVNDARSVADYLRKYHGHKDLRIITLINQEATFQNVIQNLREHFRLAGPEDVVFFYFAGHADLRRTYPKEFRQQFSSEKEPGLVCYDGTQAGYDNILFNLELAVLLEEAGKRQPHMTVIIDSNYGSQMTSVPTALHIPEGNYRGGENSGYSDFMYEYFQGNAGQTVRFQTSHIVLSATRDDKESSNEISDGGSSGGLFTRTLLHVLEQNEGSISYSDLMRQVQTLIRNKQPNQNPVLIPRNSFDTRQGFLGKEVPRTNNFDRYQVSFSEEKGWELAGGILDGLKEEEILHLEDDSEGFFRITHLGLQVSFGEMNGKTPADKGDFFVVQNPYSTTPIHVRADFSIRQLVEPTDETAWLKFVEAGETADCEAIVEDEKILVRGTDITASAEVRLDAVSLLAAFRQIRKWYILKNLQNIREDVGPEDFWVEFLIQRGEKEEMIQSDAISVDMKSEETVKLKVTAGNRTPEKIHMALFHLKDNFEILPLGNQTYEPGEETPEFVFDNGQEYELALPLEKENEECIILSVISLTKIDHRMMYQPGLEPVVYR
ncbi:MAG: caspase family protein [Bacteroidia bacterium]